jgi:hypothetical protein
MTTVFADTFYYLALLNRADADHQRAYRFTEAFSGRMYTTDWIITELADALSPARTRMVFTNFLGDLRNDPSLTIFPASKAMQDRGLKLYSERPDKDWSLTDRISFIAMRDAGITDARTADHHFEQAGFSILLK